MYFTKRNVNGVSYNGYWETPVDPDGKVRNLSSEEEFERYKRNTKQEIDFINNLPGGKILDVGCGDFKFLRALGERWVKFGCDPFIKDSWLENDSITLYKKNIEDCNFNSNYFDVVVIYHVIEHISDPISIIKEIRRVLKPNGILLLGTPNFNCWVARRFGNNFRLLHDKTHISLFSKDSMVSFLESYGFEIDEIKYPFFRTEYFTLKNLIRLLDTSKVSPPFYGNVMTFYCRKRG